MSILIRRAIINQNLKRKPKMFVIEELKSERLATGQTGVLLSAPEVSGKVYKLTLLTTSTSGTQPGISLVVDGVTIFDQKTLMDSSPSGVDMQASGDSFGVSQIYTSSQAVVGGRIIKQIYCTSFSVIKNAGNTAQSIDYVYEIGSFK